jgi:NAD(P)H-flavin reductase
MKILDCVDAGTEYCPCYLAETGECLMCSQLQGKVFCDCINWKGVCIYQEYIWNRSHCKENRPVQRCRVLAVVKVSPAVSLLTFEVQKTLARELNQPGAYIFLSACADTPYFDIPMSIMRADERAGTIEVALQEKGAKTKFFIQSIDAPGKEIYLRGPYWNGILGLKHLKSFQKGKALLIVRGIGQAPALPVAKKLVQGGNEVAVFLDIGMIKTDFTAELFQQLGCSVCKIETLDLTKRSITEELSAQLKDSLLNKGIGLIYSGGSELIHQGVVHLIQEVGHDVHFVCSNNALLCCGEGICGSCQTRLADGSRIKRCKTQLDPMEIFGRG